MKKYIGSINKDKIYDISYLEKGDLLDTDITNLIEKHLLNKSLIIGMFRFIGDNRSIYELVDEMQTDGWYDKYSWSVEQFEEFKSIVSKVYHNIYCYSTDVCNSIAMMWLDNYGFNNFTNN